MKSASGIPIFYRDAKILTVGVGATLESAQNEIAFHFLVPAPEVSLVDRQTNEPLAAGAVLTADREYDLAVPTHAAVGLMQIASSIMEFQAAAYARDKAYAEKCLVEARVVRLRSANAAFAKAVAKETSETTNITPEDTVTVRFAKGTLAWPESWK